MSSEKTSEAERLKLSFAKEVLSFAKAQGLNVGDSYQKYIKVAGDAVSYTAQAARPTELKLKTWWFPVVGSVPYLGFFDKKDRDEFAKSLESEGFEVHRGGVTAFSSLGWFADPVYSSMLRRGDVELANLYFHELTHRTLWLKDGVEFNENLAEFMADRLTTIFFKNRQRESELVKFNLVRRDYELFRRWLVKLRADVQKNLDDSRDFAEEIRVSRKNKVVSLAISDKPTFTEVDFVGSGPWNNARIMAAGLYSPDTSKFEEAAKCFAGAGQDFIAGNFLKALGKLAETSDTGFTALRQLCDHQI